MNGSLLGTPINNQGSFSSINSSIFLLGWKLFHPPFLDKDRSITTFGSILASITKFFTSFFIHHAVLNQFFIHRDLLITFPSFPTFLIRHDLRINFLVRHDLRINCPHFSRQGKREVKEGRGGGGRRRGGGGRGEERGRESGFSLSTRRQSHVQSGRTEALEIGGASAPHEGLSLDDPQPREFSVSLLECGAGALARSVGLVRRFWGSRLLLAMQA